MDQCVPAHAEAWGSLFDEALRAWDRDRSLPTIVELVKSRAWQRGNWPPALDSQLCTSRQMLHFVHALARVLECRFHRNLQEYEKDALQSLTRDSEYFYCKESMCAIANQLLQFDKPPVEWPTDNTDITLGRRRLCGCGCPVLPGEDTCYSCHNK